MLNNWQTQAIILKAKKLSEYDALISVFTPSNGRINGVVKAALSKKNRGIFQIANLVNLDIKTRHENQLPQITGELITPYAAQLMSSSLNLASLQSLCDLLETSLMEHEPQPKLYKITCQLLEEMLNSPKEQWLGMYAFFEIILLEESGFGLDLSCCAVSETREELIYVSPKSGRAVSRLAGEAWKARLLPLPSNLLRRQTPRAEQLLDSLNLSGYFLENWLYAAKNRKTPISRQQLLAKII